MKTKTALRSFNTNTRKNILCIGAEHSGKTSRLICRSLENPGDFTLLIHDKFGGMYAQYATQLKEKGYRIIRFDLAEGTVACNPFYHIYKENDLNLLTNVLLNTTQAPAYSEDEFWGRHEFYLLSALAGFLFYHRPVEEHTLSHMAEMLQAAEHPADFQETLGKVFASYPRSYTAVQYAGFLSAPERSQDDIIASCKYRMSLFLSPEAKALTDANDIHFTDLSREKTALFVMNSLHSTLTSCIAGIFWNQVLWSMCEGAFSATASIHVKCLLDDFLDIGGIWAFNHLLPKLNKENISMTFCIETGGAAENMYREDWNDIQKHCITLYMGDRFDDASMDILETQLAALPVLEQKNKYRHIVAKFQSGDSKKQKDALREFLSFDDIDTDCLVLENDEVYIACMPKTENGIAVEGVQ